MATNQLLCKWSDLPSICSKMDSVFIIFIYIYVHTHIYIYIYIYFYIYVCIQYTGYTYKLQDVLPAICQLESAAPHVVLNRSGHEDWANRWCRDSQLGKSTGVRPWGVDLR